MSYWKRELIIDSAQPVAYYVTR